MMTDQNIEFIFNGIKGVPLVWIIDGQCLYDLPLDNNIAEIFLNHDQVIDVSDKYPEHNGITVEFYKNNEILETFQTSEYFGSILLSSPVVLNLFEYENGIYVMSPNAIFDGQKFIITG